MLKSKKDFGFKGRVRKSERTSHRRERRRRQHVQGDRQTGSHRNGSRRSHDHDLLDHRAPHQRPSRQPREASLLLHPAVLARPHRRRLGHLLVHGRVHASGPPPAPIAQSGFHQEEHIDSEASKKRYRLANSKKVEITALTSSVARTSSWSSSSRRARVPNVHQQFFFIGYLISRSPFRPFSGTFHGKYRRPSRTTPEGRPRDELPLRRTRHCHDANIDKRHNV